MGSRGAGSGRNAGATVSGRRGGKMGDFLTPNGEPQLDEELIRRANAAGTVVDFGDSTARQYKNNVDEIRNMDLTDDEKRNAIKELHSLTEDQLRAEAGSLSPYSMGVGPARANTTKIRQNADKAVQARQNTRNYMDKLREDQNKKKKAKANQDRVTALQKAQANGDLSVTINGETWTRTSKRSKTWTKAR